MKKTFAIIFLIVLACAVCRAEIASWYGDECAGKLTASGQLFNPKAITCASRSYPLGTRLRVSYGNKSCIVFVTDRGPAKRLHRDIDLSEAAFKQLAPLRLGLLQVKIEPASY